METLAGQDFEIVNCPHISREKRGLSGKRSTLSPRPFPGQGKGAALEDISPVAPWEVAQPGQPVKGAKHRRIAAAMPLTGSPSYAMGGSATGDKSGRASVDGTGKTGGNFWSRCSEAVQKHRSDFSGSGVLRKVDSPLSLFTFVKGRYQARLGHHRITDFRLLKSC